jgi:hypothetical protein
LNYKFPDINTDPNSNDEDLKNRYRKFFADMRLNRLYYHIFLLKFFIGENTKEDVISSIQNNISFIDKINIWVKHLKENGNFEEFKDICNEEIKAISSIIQIYEKRMQKD